MYILICISYTAICSKDTQQELLIMAREYNTLCEMKDGNLANATCMYRGGLSLPTMKHICREILCRFLNTEVIELHTITFINHTGKNIGHV